jgi:uncharacterized protein YcbX
MRDDDPRHRPRPPAELRVAGLFIHPIKSAAACSVDEAEVGELGLELDRRFMVVDEKGSFVTQRERPELALMRVRIEPDRLIASRPGAEPLVVPREPDGPRRRVRVWSDTCEAVDVGDEAARWVGALLGVAPRTDVPAGGRAETAGSTAFRLVYMPGSVVRRVDGRYAKCGERVGFADGFPFLVLGQASVDDLGARLGAPVPVDRFRPNILVSGAPPYDEDRWERIAIGPVRLDLVKPCARCAIVDIDQQTGARGVQPLRMLSKYRLVRGKPMFGVNAIHEGRGTIRVGDRVEVLARAPS